MKLFFINLALKLKSPVKESLWKNKGSPLTLESIKIISQGHTQSFFKIIISFFWIFFPINFMTVLSVIFSYSVSMSLNI